MYCSNLKTKQTNRTVMLAFKVGSLSGRFKSARCCSFARRRQALKCLTTFDEVLCENLHKLEDSQHQGICKSTNLIRLIQYSDLL